MEDVHTMQGLESVEHLDPHPPDLVLRDKLFALLAAPDEAGEVTPLCELSDE